jgi:hypothetical protein
MSKGSNRRKENFKQVQDNWPASMGKKPYWATYSHFSNKFYNENKELIEDNLELNKEQLAELYKLKDHLEDDIEFFKLSPEKIKSRGEKAADELPIFPDAKTDEEQRKLNDLN